MGGGRQDMLSPECPQHQLVLYLSTNYAQINVSIIGTFWQIIMHVI